MYRLRWGGNRWIASVAAATLFAALTLGLGVALLAASPGAASATSARSRVGPAAGEVVTFTVTITQTDASDTTIGDGVCYVDLGPGSSGCTLRAALEEANKSAAPRVVVEFGAAAPGEISLAGPLRIERPLALLGPASGAVVIDGGGATRLLEIELPAVAATEPVRISNMTFAHGYTPGSGGAITIDNFGAAVDIVFDRVVFRQNAAYEHGGAISNTAQGVRVVDSLFDANEATGSGGAVENRGGLLTVEHSTFMNNSAQSGGAIYNHDRGWTAKYGPGTSGLLRVKTSTVSGNAGLERGGGIFNTSSSGYPAEAQVHASTITLNRTEAESPAGGGIYSGYYATTVLKQSILAGNARFEEADDCFAAPSGSPAPPDALSAPDGFLTGGDNIVGAGSMDGCPIGGSDAAISAAGLFSEVLDPALVSIDGSQPMHALVGAPTNPAYDRIALGDTCGADLLLDQRGAPRPMGPACDTGAYEMALPGVAVTTTLSLERNQCPGTAPGELAQGVLLYPCAAVVNTGNVALTDTMVTDPATNMTYTLPAALQPGQVVWLTAAQLPSLGQKIVENDVVVQLDVSARSKVSPPPGIASAVTAESTSSARRLDIAMDVTGRLLPAGALRTVTATLTYYTDQRPPPPRTVYLTVSGGTTHQSMPAQSNPRTGKSVFQYFSAYGAARARDVVRNTAAGQDLRPEATDVVQVWTDLNNNGIRDGFEPQQLTPLNTAVVLVSFSTHARRQDVTVRWQTASELNVASFRLHRGTTADGAAEVIHTAPADGSIDGATYEFVDTPPGPGSYFYWLEEVNIDSTSVMHGPLRALVGSHWILLPLVHGM